MAANTPFHDTPILGMVSRPPVESAIEFGGNGAFWVEYPSGLVDLTRKHHLGDRSGALGPVVESKSNPEPPAKANNELDIAVDGGRTLRVDKNAAALVVIDMQNAYPMPIVPPGHVTSSFFLHPDLRDHPTGLKCVDPLLRVVPSLREKGVKILWVNWGLTDAELKSIPPSLVRGFRKPNPGIRAGGFGSELPGDFGRLLMRGERNSDLYGPLQDEYLKGLKAGTDFWIHKNR
ncbi:isochorismatase hydrolase [Moniliophthora roreri]|nr:isochorismatase hydrolase [Moniliophthora roreri]